MLIISQYLLQIYHKSDIRHVFLFVHYCIFAVMFFSRLDSDIGEGIKKDSFKAIIDRKSIQLSSYIQSIFTGANIHN